LCWPSDPGWIMVNLGFYCWGWGGLASVCPSCFFWLDSHIHVWNMSQGWMAQSFYCQVERGSATSGWFMAFINHKFIPLIFTRKCIDVYADFMVDILMIFMSLLCCLYVRLVTITMYRSQHDFTCKWMYNVSMA